MNMYYLTYENCFVTGITKNDITASEECENHLQYKTRKQAEKVAKESGWLSSVEIHSENEQYISVYDGCRDLGGLRVDPKERELIREYGAKNGVWDALNRKLSVNQVKSIGAWVAQF